MKRGAVGNRRDDARPRSIASDGPRRAVASIGGALLAIPMAIYGIEHFMYADFVATIVPPWIPWHLFWAYFTGSALIAAGLSIAVKKHSAWAGILLGSMILLFVLLIHTSLLAHRPGDIPSNSAFGDYPGRLNNCFKDLGLSAAAFIFAGTRRGPWTDATRSTILSFGRRLYAIPIVAFGILHFLYPRFAPGIPPMFSNIPFPIPGHLFWVYLTGIAFLLAGVNLAIDKRTSLTATLLGNMILLFALLTWAPVFVAHPGELRGNWLKDVGVAGGALILASASTQEQSPEFLRILEVLA